MVTDILKSDLHEDFIFACSEHFQSTSEHFTSKCIEEDAQKSSKNPRKSMKNCKQNVVLKVVFYGARCIFYTKKHLLRVNNYFLLLDCTSKGPIIAAFDPFKLLKNLKECDFCIFSKNEWEYIKIVIRFFISDVFVQNEHYVSKKFLMIRTGVNTHIKHFRLQSRRWLSSNL